MKNNHNFNFKIMNAEDTWYEMFEVHDFVDSETSLREGILNLSLDMINGINEDEGMTLLMKYSKELWYEGVAILFERGVDIHVKKNDDEYDAFMYIMETYNKIMEEIIVSCDSCNTRDALNKIKCQINQGIILTYKDIKKLLENSNLNLYHEYYSITNEEYVELVKQLAFRTFDGKIEL